MFQQQPAPTSGAVRRWQRGRKGQGRAGGGTARVLVSTAANRDKDPPWVAIFWGALAVGGKDVCGAELGVVRAAAVIGVAAAAFAARAGPDSLVVDVAPRAVDLVLFHLVNRAQPSA